MKGHSLFKLITLAWALTALVSGLDPGGALAAPVTAPGSVPDYFETPNWANSPQLRKFVDTLAPLGCTTPTATLGQCIPVAVPDTTTYSGSDYYEIELVEYREQMHSDLPAVTLNNGSKINAPSGGTLLRGYRQINHPNGPQEPHFLGPLIIATKYDPALPAGVPPNGKPVRIKFVNSLPTGSGGNLFVPVDTSIMGSGPFEINYDPETKEPSATVSGNFAQNRATLHLHGGLNPWISDGTPHQWITPAGEATAYPKGVSVAYVPDMWFDLGGNTITTGGCPGSTTCNEPNATNNPGPGSQTFYYTNGQSARLLFYHDHAWGITRLNVYVGEAAGYLITDPVESAMVGGGTINGRTYAPNTIPADQIPLIIMDKTFVDPTNIATTDPTWAWGSVAPTPFQGSPTVSGQGMNPVAGDLWWPHVYMPAQNPYSPDNTGVAPLGRWVYGPWFFPPTPTCGSSPDAVKPFCIDSGPLPNPYYDPTCNPDPSLVNNNNFCQPPVIPGTPTVSWGAEAFLDTMMVNGTVYPTVTLDAKEYRLRILNAAHDRFVNLQFYVADASVPVPTDCPTCVANTEVRMVPAALTPGFPESWPTDGREGGVPDPAFRGPAMIQIGTEAGFLAVPALLPNQPVTWNTDPTTFNAGNVLQQNQGGGTLILGPAERADVIVDFSRFAGKTLILYNDSPAPWPALDPHYDYYTGAPDRRDMGGYGPVHPVGRGPNVRTIMQIKVNGAGGDAFPDAYNPTTLANLQAAFASTDASPGAFAAGQDEIVVGQSAYNTTYNTTFPSTYPFWGISRITDDFISFNDINGIPISNQQMQRKAIHDEMGGTFDDFGRLSAKLGLEIPFANAALQNFVLQNYVDPPTEFVKPGEVQIWRFTHNGVDTHPIHFHLYDVQVLNRVGWDGFIRLPDPNEIGWKDTVRISPLEDTIVALRPKLPPAPWPLPDSVHPLNPMSPIGSEFGFSQIDVNTGGNLAVPTTNQMTNFGYEYVFHCHILSHEEQDMMRSQVFNIPAAVPPAPVLAAPVIAVQKVTLSWTDSSGTRTDGVIDNTTGYIIERDTEGNGFQTIATINYLVLTYDDTTVAPATRYTYRVRAFNHVGNSPVSNTRTTVTTTWTPPTVALNLPVDGSTYSPGSTISLAADATTPGGSTITKVEFFYGGVIIGLDTSSPYTFDWTNVPAGSYQVTAKVTNSLGAFAVSPAVTVNVVGNILLVTAPATGTNFGVWKVGTTAVPPVPMTFTVTNLTGASAGPLTLTPTAPFTLTANSCNNAILNASAPGNSCTFTVAFTPAADGVVNGTVTITATSVPDAIASVSGTGDGTPPVLTLNPVAAFTSLSTPTIFGTVSDNIAVASVQVSVNAGAPVTAVITPGTPSTWAAQVTITTNGLPNAISVIATDTAQPGGNPTAPPLTASITYDNTPPAVNITSPAAGLTNNPQPPLTYTATDANLISVSAILDGITLASVPAALGPFTDSAHTITIDAVDAAGTHGSATSSFTVDATPPVIVITSPPAGTVLTASPTLTYTVTDANPNATLTVVRVDGNVVANPVSGMTLGPLAAGVHTLTIDATDLAGNVSPTSSVTFTIFLGPALTVTPASVSYSNVAVNLPASPTGFTISNNGNTGFPLAITGISLSGTNAADFQLNYGTCGTGTLSIPVGGSCTFTVALAPLSTGPKFANVNVTATGETPASLLLSGSGVAAVTNPVRSTAPTQTGYTTLTAAFAAATGNATLQAMNAVLPAATLTVNSTGTVNFTGGYDALWGTRSGMTNMQGVLTIQNGSLVVNGLVIK